jgi:hypothetical protein
LIKRFSGAWQRHDLETMKKRLKALAVSSPSSKIPPPAMTGADVQRTLPIATSRYAVGRIPAVCDERER